MTKTILIVTLLLFTSICYSQTVTGIIIDSINKEPLPGANIIDAESKNQCSSNNKGSFTLKCKSNVQLSISFIGFKTQKLQFSIRTDTNIIIGLTPENTSLQEIRVEAQGNSNSKSSQPTTYLNQTKITKIPTMLGESDVIKTLAISPGVKQIEGRQGFNVRGGSQDQNLLLYDEAVIYNCSHLLGMYSVFNTNAMQNVTFYKAGIPVRYGGRLASVMVIEGNGGNMNHWENHASIGILASNLSFSGPIVKDKCSISISGRRSYIDKIILPIVNSFSTEKVSKYKNGYFFQDLNAKIIYKANKNNKFEISSYIGNDEFKLANAKNNLSNQLQWGNAAASLKWRHIFNESLSCAQSLAWSQNYLKFKMDQDLYDLYFKTSIKTLRFKSDWLLTTFNNPLRFGIEMNHNTYNPNKIDASIKEVALNLGTNNILHSIESAAFIEYPFNIGTHITINPGLRYSFFSQLGPFTNYKQDLSGQIIDSTQYTPNQKVKSYSYPEPRLLANYIIDDNTTIKASASYNVQYNHLIPIISSALPTEMWLPSMDGIKPQKAIQFSSGYFKSGSNYTFSVDAYYKRMYDMSESSSAMVSFYDSKKINSIVTQGRGYAYGIEFYFEKNLEKFSYTLSYTFSRSMRIFQLYGNKAFPAKYDKPHDLTITGNYNLNKRWSISALFTYSSGVNVTMPIARYLVQGNLINYYGSKNGYRMPAYHRADISVKYSLNDKAHYKSDLIFSISNLYNHKNPYYMYYKVSGSIEEYKLQVETEKVYLFPILPSLTYNITF